MDIKTIEIVPHYNKRFIVFCTGYGSAKDLNNYRAIGHLNWKEANRIANAFKLKFPDAELLNATKSTVFNTLLMNRINQAK